ncbi:MAG: class I SAM-dependent methyltransferase [Proteobacteria bacterium]|nr:class I SAM-dependent methyltransferase [Pseudomonadota bacterium]MBU1451949.1 class I SAM-dependent methyltransferase [Pseudomonadota bacterium]MBU2468003.1 class I SAM-dependent methyltransferase [Pseudomonadota bacterium]
MDHVFEAAEAQAYESWLATPAGQKYSHESNALLDRALDFRPGWRVLDVGCGLGVHLAHLAARGAHVHGLEAGPVAARLAAGRLGSKAEIRVGDAHDLPYEDNSFDAVILVNTLEFTERRAQVLAEAARVASSRLCLIAMNPLAPRTWLSRLPGAGHPFSGGVLLPPWSLFRLVREVLGPVPRSWAATPPWPGSGLRHWPLGDLWVLCAAVTPRYRTRPLTVTATAGTSPAQPMTSHGRVSVLRRVK